VSAGGLGRRASTVARTPLARVAAIVLVLAAAAVALGAVLLSRTAPPPARVLDPPVTVKRALSTNAALFGDPVGVEVDVYSADAIVAPGSVRVAFAFAPYRVTSTVVDRERQGGISLLRTRLTLACLTAACLPPRGGARSIRFADLVVRFRRGAHDEQQSVPWEPLRLSSRLPPGAVPHAGIVDAPPPLDPRLARSPAMIRALMFLAAAAAGLVGAALLVTAIWPSSILAQRRSRRLSPLARSLARVQAAASGDDAAARRASLDELANRLAEVPSPSLERRTRALAWGKRPPEKEALELLADEVRSTLNGAASA
jgi:hypothetical protein